MSPERIEVSTKALAQLLHALVGPAHHIRELQVTRNMPQFEDSEPNCIDLLLKEFNEQVK